MDPVTWIAPTRLVRAEVDLGRGRRTVTEPLDLFYTAQRHHLNVVYWVVLDPPLAAAGLDRPVFVVEVSDPHLDLQGDESVRYLDEDFVVIASPSISEYHNGFSGRRFRRGDVSGDGEVQLDDAVRLLDHLFHAGEAPSCARTGDANDDGRLDLTDAVGILLHLFARGAPPVEPFPGCGPDLTPDELSCESYRRCDR
jgi:hypothetical protein